MTALARVAAREGIGKLRANDIGQPGRATASYSGDEDAPVGISLPISVEAAAHWVDDVFAPPEVQPVSKVEAQANHGPAPSDGGWALVLIAGLMALTHSQGCNQRAKASPSRFGEEPSQ